MNVLREKDVRTEVLRPRCIAILGYGSQGQAHALNLRDSGYQVLIGLPKESPSCDAARAAGFTVHDTAEAVRRAAVVMVLIPDEAQPDVYPREIGPHLQRGAYLGFAHGFAIHYRKIIAPAHVNVFLAAPNGVGQLVRRQYQAGHGVPAVIAVHQDPAGDTFDVAAAYACGIGAGRAGILSTTFREETETDLFAEQAVLCGGLTALIRTGFETLVDAGYSPEMAYFACLHEVKLLADLIHERGIAGMRSAISNTAKYGDVTRGHRVLGDESRQAMRTLLAEIQSGAFADEWMAECAAGKRRLTAALAQAANHPIEAVGRRLRALMPWLEASGEDASSDQAASSRAPGGSFVPSPEASAARAPQVHAGDFEPPRPPEGDRPRACLNAEPVDATGCEWPGFESPPEWYVKGNGTARDR